MSTPFKVSGNLIATGNVIARDGLVVGDDINIIAGNIYLSANANVFVGNDTLVKNSELGSSLGLLRAALEAPAGNVLYVTTDGDDNNSGTSLSNAFANIHVALNRANAWTTVFVKSGDYVLYEQPVTIKARVGMVGDNLRTTTIRPSNVTQDMFYVENASYVTGITFRDHQSPAAVFSYNPDGSAGTITTSPYIQNCSSITTSGTGMRVDGRYVSGLRSMVCDSYTQTNAGGIGIHMLNRGYTQLVSVFTICCDIAILCEDGGFCSITNSNSSFGNYGLVSRGVSSPNYYGKVQELIETDEGQQLILFDLDDRPKYGDVLLIANYNQAKCARDTGLIVDSLAIDLAYGSNTQSTFSGLQYYAQSASAIPNQAEETIAAFDYAKNLATNVIQNIAITSPYQANVSQVTGTASDAGAAAIINQEFDLVANIITGGTVGVTDRIVPNQYPPTSNTIINNAANLLLSNYAFIKAEVIAYVDNVYPGFFDEANNFINPANARTKCERDTGYLLDSIRFDLLHGGNRQAIMSGVYYYNFNANVTQINNQVVQTAAAYEFIGSIVDEIVQNILITDTYQNTVTQNTTAFANATLAEANAVLTNIDLIKDIINDGPTVTPHVKAPIVYENRSTDVNVINATQTLLTNRDFIVAEVVTYVNRNWANISNGTQQFYTVSNSTPLVGNVSSVTFLELIDETIFANSTVSFHQPSYISASGHTFEYVGSGVNLATALPYAGGFPIQENEVIQQRGGQVYFTSTDQQGDFRIGTGLLFNRVDGTITGETFNKALFSIMTPYVLAIEG
jgi:hypothetical protein